MKILILNGSPRKGNTVTAIDALVKGIGDSHEVEIINTYDLKIAPCKGCGTCQCYKGCIDEDHTNPIVDKCVAADMLVFATPVYWWGMTAQLKLVLDKCYCKGAYLKNKKAGLIVVGGSETTHRQYDLIKDQFGCIEEYLGWEFLFNEKFYASKKDDLQANEEAINHMIRIGAKL